MIKKQQSSVPRGTQLQATAGKIKARRLSLGMTIDDLAQKTGISWPTLSNLETGKLKSTQTAKLEQICNSLGWTLADLFNVG